MNKLTIPLLMYRESGSKQKGTFKQSYVVPSWNHLYILRGSRQFLDKWAIKHKKILIRHAKQWVIENEWKIPKNHKVIVRMWVFWNDRRRRDCHNIDKLILDSFEGVIYEDDSFVLLRFMDFDIDRENPRIEVEFEIGEPFNR
jgi:Holliday junction resolvase RusA-like endonuclease